MTAAATLITGANRGIGRALVTEGVARGQTVIGTCRGTPPDPPAIRWEHLDVADPAGPQALSQRLGGTGLSLLVCNAGVFPDDPANPADWQQGFAVNVTGVYLTISALLPQIRDGRGKIAIIASQMGSSTRAPGGSLIYRATKAAVINLGRNLATDLRSEGIAVGIYHPGWVQTDMGGEGAEITAGAAATGLMDRFADLDIARTGVWQDWQGQILAY